MEAVRLDLAQVVEDRDLQRLLVAASCRVCARRRLSGSAATEDQRAGEGVVLIGRHAALCIATFGPRLPQSRSYPAGVVTGPGWV